MKKMLALVLTLTLLTNLALAEVCTIKDDELTIQIDIGSLERYELTDEDIENGIVLWFGDGGAALDCAIYREYYEDMTLEEALETTVSYTTDTLVSSGMTEINGRKFSYIEEIQDGDSFISYFTIENGEAVELVCCYDGQAAARRFNEVMSTITIASNVSNSASFFSSLASFLPAGRTSIADTGLSLDLTGMKLCELDEDDIEDDIALWFLNNDETLNCIVWCYDADGYTLADMAEEIAEEEGCVSCGYTTINGIDSYFWVGSDEDGMIVEYFIISDDQIVQISFLCADDAAATQSGQIMNTLQ